MKPIILNIDDFPKEFDFHNDQFPPLDALTYWHFLKKAQKVVEVGCGYSTYLAWKAGKQITAVDPQPRIMYPEIPYLNIPVQEAPVNIFNELRENDILFIDSSHIYSEGSDVHFLIHQVIPNLKSGVLIHFHDYFGLYGYPQEWQNHPEMKYWNENDHVLQIQNNFRLIAFNYEISKQYNDQLKLAYSFVPQNITNNLGAVRGASLWLKVI